jgi:hypothetical protein
MIDLQNLKNAIYTPLKKAGFMNKSQSLYLDGDDTIIVINLQKSNWSKLYYINMGIWLKAFGEGLFPKFNHCHLYYRIEHFFPTKRELILTACNLDRSDLVVLSLSLYYFGQTPHLSPHPPSRAGKGEQGGVGQIQRSLG